MAEKDLKSHTFTHEEQSRGGKSKSILKSIVKKKKCNKDCKLFNRCPFASVGLKYNTCYLNCSDHPTLKRLVSKILEGDEKDFYDAVAIIISDMVRICECEDDSNIRSKKTVVDSLEKLHNMRFGTKNKTEISGKIDIELFKKYLEGEKIE